jgi:hypothetical protein
MTYAIKKNGTIGTSRYASRLLAEYVKRMLYGSGSYAIVVAVDD